MEKFLNLPIEKQNRIIDAAFMMFGTNGYKKASISDIAAAAGISKAMIFHYFGTKKELYFFLIDYCGDLVMHEINEKFDPTITDFFDRIITTSEIKLSISKKHPYAISFLGSIYFETEEEVQDHIREIMSKGDEFRKKIAFEGMDTNKFKDGVDPKLVLKTLLWMAEGFASSFKGTGFTNENLKEFMQEYYECMYLLKNNFYKEEYLT